MERLLSFNNFHLKLDEFLNVSLDDVLNENFDNTVAILKNAIENKYICTIYYKGEQKGVVDDGYRFIEPCAIGMNEQGNTVLRAWLIKGVTRSGKIDPSLVPGWRLFRIDRIKNIASTFGSFGEFSKKPHKGYNSHDNGMVEVYYSVKY